MAAPCTCPNGQHNGRFPYCSNTSGGPIVIDRLPAPGPATVSCEAVPMPIQPEPRARIAELEAERLPHMCRMDHPTVRFEDPEERFAEPYNCPWCEVVRLEALILQINDDLGRTWDTGLVDAEALRIRSRVP